MSLTLYTSYLIQIMITLHLVANINKFMPLWRLEYVEERKQASFRRNSTVFCFGKAVEVTVARELRGSRWRASQNGGGVAVCVSVSRRSRPFDLFVPPRRRGTKTPCNPWSRAWWNILPWNGTVYRC